MKLIQSIKLAISSLVTLWHRNIDVEITSYSQRQQHQLLLWVEQEKNAPPAKDGFLW
jgi:hypothetical protein